MPYCYAPTNVSVFRFPVQAWGTVILKNTIPLTEGLPVDLVPTVIDRAAFIANDPLNKHPEPSVHAPVANNAVTSIHPVPSPKLFGNLIAIFISLVPAAIVYEAARGVAVPVTVIVKLDRAVDMLKNL